MVTTPFRGEHWEVSYGVEGTYGTAPAAAATKGMSRFLGLFERGQMPDPEIEFSPIYGAGGEQARRPIRTYRGRWALSMNVSDILLLDGKALGLAIGETYTVVQPQGSTTTEGSMATSGTANIAGATSLVCDGSVGGTGAGQLLQVGTPGSDFGVATKCEIVEVLSGTGSTVTLALPLLYDHAASQQVRRVLTPAGYYYRHTIVETTTLPSISVNAAFWRAGDAAASPELIRRYNGGKVGRASIRVEEGEMARLNLDEITFADMQWNNLSSDQSADSSLTGYDNTLAYLSNITLPTTDPYYFSGGTLTMEDSAIATVRSFGMEFGQNVEPKYYISGHDPAIPRPRLALEGRREYTMTVNLDPQDTVQYRELMRDGLRRQISGGSPSNTLPLLNTGIGVLFEFQRDSATNPYASKDKISIMVPGDVIDDPGKGSGYTWAAPTESNQGAYIRRGRLDVTGDPVQNQELELVARSIKIVVHDQDSWVV